MNSLWLFDRFIVSAAVALATAIRALLTP